jgi:hypothetical protein
MSKNVFDLRQYTDQAEPLRTVDRLSVWATRDSSTIALPVRFRPVIACHDVPVADNSGRWVWAVALGDQLPDGGIAYEVPVQRFRFTEPADRRFGWLYRLTDLEQPSDEAIDRLRKIEVDAAASLEHDLAGTLGTGLLVYRRSKDGRLVRAHPVRHTSSVRRMLGHERTDNLAAIDIVAVAFCIAVAF